MLVPRVQPEVAAALADGRPVVALETTLVSHGFSAGRGLAAARESERRVRAAGAVPATIGIVDGQIMVGLADDELDRFAAAGLAARKVGARDVAACVVQGALGSTTVGGTLAICRLAGISFLGTGGIGGVHRAERDPSAETHERRVDRERRDPGPPMRERGDFPRRSDLARHTALSMRQIGGSGQPFSQRSSGGEASSEPALGVGGRARGEGVQGDPAELGDS